MGFPNLGQLFARFLEPQLIPQSFGLVALLCLDRGKVVEFRVEPLLTYFQRGKALIPVLLATRAGLDVLHHEDTDWKQLAEKGGQAQFPLPTRPGRRRQFFLAVLPVLPGLAARQFAIATSAAHLARCLFRFLDSLSGFRLDIDVGMSRRDDAIALALAARIDPDGDRLDFPR